MARYEFGADLCTDFGQSSKLEWLLPNGIGGYAMGTVSGANTRRYHGLLVAAIPPPSNRIVLLTNIEAHVTTGWKTLGLSTNQYVGAIHPAGFEAMRSLRVGEHAEWEFAGDDVAITRRLKVHPGRNACTVQFLNEGHAPVELTLRPLVQVKPYHENFRYSDSFPTELRHDQDRTVVEHRGVALTLQHPGASRIPTAGWYYRFEQPREAERGLEPIDDCFCPCELTYHLGPGERATLVAHAESGPVEPAVFGPLVEGQTDALALLKAATNAFIIDTPQRATIIAGYPWFTDWGRDTMIALPGLCLATGRAEFAKRVLRAFAGQMRDGLIPNRFVEKGDAPEYHTVDGTLWFVNAIFRVLEHEWDEGFAREAFGWVRDVVEHHLRGTQFGIRVDPEDGLLTQGRRGLQLTWMDAKVGDWVVTPRHGKPVEINGLWINALRIGAWLGGKLGLRASDLARHADRAEAGFEPKFWHARVGHYLDTADPDDASFRPNQILAMGLPFSPMRGATAEVALAKARAELLTPYGLRTLGPNEPGYRGRFEGPLGHRDAAYHQGTVWPWLLGSYCSATLRVTGNRDHVRDVLSQARAMLTHYGIGGVAEVYDGDEPHRPDGCPWQAWSVAELLRAQVELEAAGG